VVPAQQVYSSLPSFTASPKKRHFPTRTVVAAFLARHSPSPVRLPLSAAFSSMRAPRRGHDTCPPRPSPARGVSPRVATHAQPSLLPLLRVPLTGGTAAHQGLRSHPPTAILLLHRDLASDLALQCSHLPGLLKAYVARVCFKYFRCFRSVLQVFHTDVTKVDRDVAYVAMVCTRML
jgi:hypothetical protein